MIKYYFQSLFVFFILNVKSQQNNLCFRDTLNYTVGQQPISISDGDYNNDGILDLAVSNQTTNDVNVLFGVGNGVFTLGATYTVGANPTCVISTDFNKDGNLDLLTTNQQDHNLSLLFGTGLGTFLPVVNYTANLAPSFAIPFDYNADGNTDVIVSNISSNDVSILTGSPSGTLSTAINYTAGTGPYALVVNDFNKDGYIDIVTGNLYSNDVSILLGTNTGTFSSPVSYSVGTFPYSIVSRDFDKDNNLDLIVSNISSNDITVLLGLGDGTFSAPVSYTVGSFPSSVSSNDFNKDGNDDLVITNLIDNNIYLLLGNGDATFSTPNIYIANTNPRSVHVSDLNYDNNPDFIVTNNSSSNITVFMNAIPSLTVNSGSICSGDVFTITPQGASSYTFSSGTSTVSPISNASYTVVGTGVLGCTNTAVSSVTVKPVPQMTVASTANVLCSGETATLSVLGADNYVWNTNETTADIIISPTILTNYTVTGTLNGCNNTAVITQSVSVCTRVENISDNNGKPLIVPNPNNGLFFVKTANYNSRTQIEIIDAMGQVVLKKNIVSKETVIDLGSEKKGIYFIMMTDGNSMFSNQKIVIE